LLSRRRLAHGLAVLSQKEARARTCCIISKGGSCTDLLYYLKRRLAHGLAILSQKEARTRACYIISKEEIKEDSLGLCWLIGFAHLLQFKNVQDCSLVNVICVATGESGIVLACKAA
jgi:hypothetical protein